LTFLFALYPQEQDDASDRHKNEPSD
jgi:hypothetical protein